MRVRIKGEERIFQGTAKQVVQQMHGTAQHASHLSLSEYVDWCARNGTTMGHDVKVVGEAEEDRCASLLEEMVRLGVAENLGRRGTHVCRH